MTTTTNDDDDDDIVAYVLSSTSSSNTHTPTWAILYRRNSPPSLRDAAAAAADDDGPIDRPTIIIETEADTHTSRGGKDVILSSRRGFRIQIQDAESGGRWLKRRTTY